MSSVGVGEAEARQAFLDLASAQFVSAHGAGIFNENGEELYSDDTYRPVVMPPPTQTHEDTPLPQSAPECYDIASVASDRSAPSRKRDAEDLEP